MPATHESVLLVLLRLAVLLEGRLDLLVVLLGGVVQRVRETPHRLNTHCKGAEPGENLSGTP